MTFVDLIGLRFDGYGRPGHQTAAAGSLRRAGIVGGAAESILDRGDVVPAAQSGERGPNRLVNEGAVAEVSRELARRVAQSIRAGRFPLVVGGDCSALLGSVTGARAAVARLRRSAPGWWLHVDVDVLDPLAFPAQGLPDFPDEPGGLSRDELEAAVRSAAAAGGCVGASIAIYDPDQDPDGSGAAFVVRLAHVVVAAARP